MDDPEAGGGGEAASAAASRLNDDVVVEILSRLPARSLHRFQCVSRHWRDLITGPDHRGRMAQSLAGFVYIGYTHDKSSFDARATKSLRFTSARAGGTSPGGGAADAAADVISPSALSFPPDRAHPRVHRVDCSNGLLLLSLWPVDARDGYSYAVCNPATGEWADVPDSPSRGVGSSTARLAFDPASPRSFRVFEFSCDGMSSTHSTAARIYASETGAWTYRRASGWGGGAGAILREDASSVFFEGTMHFCPLEPEIVTVDRDGRSWGSFPKPADPRDDGFLGGPPPGFIGVSQGRLRFLNTPYNPLKLRVWDRERDGDGGGAWIPKHSINLREVFGGWDPRVGLKYRTIGVHPDGNVAYFLEGKKNRLVAGDMDRGDSRTICELGDPNYGPYLPYVPLLSPSFSFTGEARRCNESVTPQG